MPIATTLGKIIATFSYKRIRYFDNDEWLGISKSRNKCVELASWKYLFFTDDEYTMQENWIE
jgi:hypothetical protein